MLITILCLIGLVIVAMIAIRIFGQDASSPSFNRQKRKSKARHEPTLSPLEANDDADEVLGLNANAQIEPESTPVNAAPKVIAFYLVAKADEGFMGYDLLQAILSAGFRFGDMNIFHRHEHRAGKGAVLFSLSSISEPGTFDIDNMGGFSCRGLTIFMQYDRISDPVHVLDLMIEAGAQLHEELGGRLLAGDRQPLDQATVTHYRQQIEDYVLQHTS